eukprot:3373275-Amphidinium_carterae.1
MLSFPPRELTLLASRSWYVFTDACAEWAKDGTMKIHLGAVLFQEGDSTPKYFWDAAPPHDLQHRWMQSKIQPIAPAELYAVLAAKSTWRELLREQRVLWFIDNMGAKAVLAR